MSRVNLLFMLRIYECFQTINSLMVTPPVIIAHGNLSCQRFHRREYRITLIFILLKALL